MALSKRIGQISIGLAKKNYQVSLIIRNQYLERINKNDAIQRSITLEDSKNRWNINKLHSSNIVFRILRPIITYFHLLVYGDYTGYLLKSVIHDLPDKLEKPDIILSFFTPRGPIFLAEKLAKYYKCPYILDFQDNFDIGLRKDQIFLSKIWMKKMVKDASFCVHVSPEWSQRDGRQLDREFQVLRHAVPVENFQIETNNRGNFKIFYGGSLNPKNQSPDFFILGFLNAIQKNSNILFQYAGGNDLGMRFRGLIPENNYKYLGWLDEVALNNEVSNSDCLLLIGWSRTGRKVVPSKLYEYMSYRKPILIAGNDTGGINILLEEWNHPDVVQNSVELIEKTILEGSKKCFNNYLIPEKCKNVLYEDRLVDEYEKMIFDSIHYDQ